jgi:hypothetical protein
VRSGPGAADVDGDPGHQGVLTGPRLLVQPAMRVRGDYWSRPGTSRPSASNRSPPRSFRMICSGVCRRRFIRRVLLPVAGGQDSHPRRTNLRESGQWGGCGGWWPVGHAVAEAGGEPRPLVGRPPGQDLPARGVPGPYSGGITVGEADICLP